MTLGDTLQREGFRAQETVAGDPFVTLKDNQRFLGVLEVLPGIDPRLELGSDIRELSCLHILREDLPEHVHDQDSIAQGETIWRVIRREDNPADVVVKLWVVKVVPGKDQPRV